jgi:3-dehydroquinate dehydratase-1
MNKVRIGKWILGSTPRVVGCVTSVQTARKQMARKSRPFEIAEFRADLMGMNRLRDGILCAAMEKSGIPVLLTVRSQREGGQWSGSVSELRAFYKGLLPKVSAVDVEIQSDGFQPLIRDARAAKKTAIASFHDFKRTPSLADLKRLVRQGRKGGAQVVKVAAMVKKPADIITLYELLRETDEGPLCVIGMGPAGLSTRIGLPCAGSCLAYGFIDDLAAPGQLSCQELKDFFSRGRASR